MPSYLEFYLFVSVVMFLGSLYLWINGGWTIKLSGITSEGFVGSLSKLVALWVLSLIWPATLFFLGWAYIEYRIRKDKLK